MNELPNNGNYPPGVTDSHPYFNPPDIDHDPDEVRNLYGYLDEAIDILEEAADILVHYGYVTKEWSEDFLDRARNIEDELDYCIGKLDPEDEY